MNETTGVAYLLPIGNDRFATLDEVRRRMGLAERAVEGGAK